MKTQMKRSHPSGSKKRLLSARRALKQAAEDPKQRTLSLCVQPEVNMGENSRGPRGETDTPERDIDLPASTASESETVDDEHVAMTGDVGNAANATTSHNDISTDCSMSTELTLVEESQKLLQNIHKSDVNVDAGLHVATGDDAVEQTYISTTFPSDKFRFDNDNSNLTRKHHISWLVATGACQPGEQDMHGGIFPKTLVEATKSRRASARRFCSSYYFTRNSLDEPVKHSWLAYSFRGDYCYCHVCWLFGDAEVQSSAWVTGLRDWKHIGQSIDAHVKSKTHKNCVGACTQYEAGNSLDAHMRKLQLAEEEKWRHILTQQFDLIRLLAGLGLPLRGHRETADSDKPGVYLSVLRFISKSDSVLAQHLADDSRIKYLSKTILEEQIQVLAREVRNVLIAECKAAKFFTVIADSSPDISHKDQMAVLLRYVAIDREKKTVDIHERFTGYFQVTDGTATGICSVIERVLFESFQLEYKYLTGQAYDGASVMSGSQGGLQAVMKERLKTKGNTFIPYVHCPPHQLNLVLVHAAESGHPIPPIEVCTFFDVVQSVYNYFSCSYRRWELLMSNRDLEPNSGGHDFIDFPDGHTYDKNADSNADAAVPPSTDYPEACDIDVDESVDPVQSGKGKPQTLKSLSKTRWSARKDATSALLAHFGGVLESLATLIDNRHDSEEVKQAYNLQHQLDWTFLLTLIWWNEVLLIVDCASRLMQAKRNDLFMIVDCFKRTAEQLEELRSDAKFQEFMQRATQMWVSLGFTADAAKFKEIRVRRKKRMADELLRDELPPSPEYRYKIDIYFRVLDSMAGEIRNRCDGLQDVCQLFGFLHSHHLSLITQDRADECVENLSKRFPQYFTSSW